jgi:hypothetical protein
VLIELVDALRCPRAHDTTWLVASADRTEGRDIMAGTLGCPICHAEYPIRNGVVWFEPEGASPLPHRSGSGLDPHAAIQLAAFLDLSDPRGFAVLSGSWGAAAPLLVGQVPTHLVVMNPRPHVAAGNGVSVLEISTGIPLADGSCRGVALDAAHADAPHLDAAVRVLQPRGRLVGPAATPMPSGVTELARDDRLWVAERGTAPPRLITLQSRESAP